jgi:YggT family protein
MLHRNAARSEAFGGCAAGIRQDVASDWHAAGRRSGTSGDVNLFWQLLYIVFWMLRLLLIARFLLEMVRSFARSWYPTGRPAIAVESVYTVTDPPVRLLRRIVPTVRFGGMALDLSLIILLLVLSLVILPIIANLALRTS